MRRNYYLHQGISILFLTMVVLSCLPSGGSAPTTIVTALTPNPTASSTFAPTATRKPTATPWLADSGSGINFRAVHMSGNWGTNRKMIEKYGGNIPADYLIWLRDMHVNWVGISVAVYVDDILDSTVERIYEGVTIPTFTDVELSRMISGLRQHGFNVYLTMAFEQPPSSSPLPALERWQLGWPSLQRFGMDTPAEYWLWSPEHPDHYRFVAEFWKTYTEQAVHFAEIAEREGVGLFSLGTEQEGLFRNQPFDGYEYDYGDEVRAMVQAVRAVYSGMVTYDYHFSGLMEGDETAATVFWDDAGLDVIGISAYFPLDDAEPVSVISVEEFESRWVTIFEEYLVPLKTANPDKLMLFTEFGYTDSLAAPFRPAAEAGNALGLKDNDGNGFDDGQEMQANMIDALFRVMDRYPGVVQGTFLWDNWMSTNDWWAQSGAQQRGFFVRGKLAEEVVRQKYLEWIEQP